MSSRLLEFLTSAAQLQKSTMVTAKRLSTLWGPLQGLHAPRAPFGGDEKCVVDVPAGGGAADIIAMSPANGRHRQANGLETGEV